jgi:MYXO-CTERM domain-containing protein
MATSGIDGHSVARADCDAESQCSFKKPGVVLVLDYSSSMSGLQNAPAYFPAGQTKTTRWDAEVDAASWILRYGAGFFADNARIALTRFAHDPEPLQPATTIKSDRSFPAIVDGFAIDVPFDGTNGRFLECKSSGVEAALTVLRGTAPPPVSNSPSLDSIMLTWTRGALRSAHALIDRTRDHHKSEPNEAARDYAVVLLTDGDWTCPNRIGQSCDQDENPAKEAAQLRAAGIPVHVIAFGDATMQPSLNDVALQGGTVAAIDAASPQGIVDAFSSVLDNIRDTVIVPTCTQKLPRMLVVMDASTSMLTGTTPGATKWDKARFALAGNPNAPNPSDPGYVEPVLTRKLTIGGRDVAIEDVVHIGLTAFAGPNDQQLMANFGPCMRDNIAWAMNPSTSCVAPGCSDPYAGTGVSWTFKDSAKDRQPAFINRTRSYMPATESATPTTFTGQGLEFARKVVGDYKQNSAPFKIAADTRFVNVLVTDGETSEGSSDVPAVLAQMVSEGVDTYVIGFGTGDELDREQLERYAVAGNTQHAILVDPVQSGSSAALADALAGVVTSLGIDSCCVLNQCASAPEPALPHAVCGDGHVDEGELCDDGKDNATYAHCGGDCKSRHLRCGDGRIERAHEECDDGNTLSGDLCDPHCHIPTNTSDGDADAGVSNAGGAGAAGSSTRGAAGLAPSFTPPTPAKPTSPSQTAGMPAAQAGSAAVSGMRSSGCSCRLQPSAASTHLGWLPIGLLGLGAVWQRRRRARRS